MKRWLSKAEESLGNHSDRLNAINIFPVADGDTAALATRIVAAGFGDTVVVADLPGGLPRS